MVGLHLLGTHRRIGCYSLAPHCPAVPAITNGDLVRKIEQWRREPGNQQQRGQIHRSCKNQPGVEDGPRSPEFRCPSPSRTGTRTRSTA